MRGTTKLHKGDIIITKDGTKVEILDCKAAWEVGRCGTKKYNLITCPKCGQLRWAESKHMSNPVFTGWCLHCSNVIQIRHALPQKANNPPKSWGEPNRLWKKKIQKIDDNASYHHTEEHNKHVSQTLLGRTKSPEIRARMAEATRLKWQDPEYRKKHLDALMGTPEKMEAWQKAARGGQKKHPNRNEKRIQAYLDKLFPNEYKFVGDDVNYQTNGLFPDHIHNNGKKKIILAHGTHWHKNDDLMATIKRYSDGGYDCLIMWEHETKNVELSESKLIKFHTLPNGNINELFNMSQIKLPIPKWS